MEKSKNNIINNKILLLDTNLEIKTEIKSSELSKEELELKHTIKKTKFKTLTKLKNHIDTLSKNEYIEIYKIIKINNEKYSQNKNGIMFDIMKFKDDTIEKIINFINYIETNNLLVDTDEQKRNSYRTLLT